MANPARSLYEALRALEHRAAVARRKAGLPSSRREAAAVAHLDGRRISSWLPADPALAQVPRADDADKVWALVRVWSDWAGDRTPEQRYWMDLIDAAQPARARRPAAAVAGWLLTDLTDQFAVDALEVHRPLELDIPERDLPVLPAYVRREHDDELAQVVTAAAAGSSRIAVLVGGSSTGKTRACWEALRLIRGQQQGWRLWHPIDPSRPEAALRQLPAIGPRTVVWLNEAQLYLDAPVGLGEKVAAGLRELLRDPARGPVLVLATLWPQFWDALTSRPVVNHDPHAQVRELLAAHDIAVPAVFTSVQLRRLGKATDVRLALAARAAQDGQVVQFLAGAPELLGRYRNAPPPARALINAAMDARRLGMRRALPHAFLEMAGPGYLSDSEWDQMADNWLEEALAYTAAPCKGVRGPLTRIRTRPAARHAGRSIGPVYHLADYLEQQGRVTRREHFPPAAFWAAASSHADPGDLGALGDAAYDRGLYRDAAQLRKQAAAHGDIFPASRLIGFLHSLHPDDQRPAHWSAAHADLGDPGGVADLLRGLWAVGAGEQAKVLLARDPAAHVTVDDPGDVALLLRELRTAGAGEQADVLANRAAAHSDLGDPSGVTDLLAELRKTGAGEHAKVLLARDPAAHVALHDPLDAIPLLRELRVAGAGEQADMLLARDPATHVTLERPGALAHLLRQLQEAEAREETDMLLARAPAAHVTLDEPDDVAYLLMVLQMVGAVEQATVLAKRAAAHGDLSDPGGVADLLRELQAADAGGQADMLLGRHPAAHVTLSDPGGVADLLRQLRAAGAGEQATVLANRAAAHVTLGDPGGVAFLLRELRKTDAGEQAKVLLARDPAAHVTLDNRLYGSSLLSELGVAGAEQQAKALVDRLPGAGMFRLFLEYAGQRARLRFGREADGSPARRWGWEDLS